jgi:hypothetical protein
VEASKELKGVSGKIRTIDKEVINWVLRRQTSEVRQSKILENVKLFGGRFHPPWKDTPENVLHILNMFRTETRWIYEHLYNGRTRLTIHRTGSCQQKSLEECYKRIEEYHYGREVEDEISAFAEDTFGVEESDDEEEEEVPVQDVVSDPKGKMANNPNSNRMSSAGNGGQTGESSHRVDRVSSTVKFPSKIDLRSMIKYSGEP